MVYKIRLKAREKQAQCSAILFLSFMITALVVLTVNLFPLVYISAIKPYLSENIIVSAVISVLLAVLSLVIYSALSMGTDRFMLKRAENISAGAGDMFYYFRFKKLINMCRFYIVFSARKLFTAVFLAVPFLICLSIFFSISANGFSVAVCAVFGVFSIIFFMLFVSAYVKLNDTYFLVKYKYIKGDYINFNSMFADAQNSLQNEVKRLRRLKLSFIGWFILCVFVLPIPYVWSYYRQCKACFAADII